MYIFERDIKALGGGIVSEDEIISIIEKHGLEELEAPGLPERVFIKKPMSGFENIPKIVTIDAYEQFYCGDNLEYGRRRGVSMLNQLGLSTQMCFSPELESTLVSDVTVLDVNGLKLMVYPLDSYNSDKTVEDMVITALNNYLGHVDYCRDTVLWGWKDAGLDIDYIKAGLNDKAKEWLGGV